MNKLNPLGWVASDKNATSSNEKKELADHTDSAQKNIEITNFSKVRY